jgi:hypothetical protein
MDPRGKTPYPQTYKVLIQRLRSEQTNTANKCVGNVKGIIHTATITGEEAKSLSSDA